MTLEIHPGLVGGNRAEDPLMDEEMDGHGTFFTIHNIQR